MANRRRRQRPKPRREPRARPDPPRRCGIAGKIIYLEAEAESALDHAQQRIAAGTQRGTAPIRAYPCDACGGWHLTSQPRRSPPI